VEIKECYFSSLWSPAPKLQAWCYDLVHARWFGGLVIAVVMANMAFLASNFYNQPQWWSSALNTIDAVFVAIYIVEVAVKMSAVGFR
jgi:Ion transport protein